MSFAWPWLFAVLPLPWLLRMLLPPLDAGAALRLPSLPAIAHGTAVRPAMPLWIVGLAWLLLVTAAARPQIPDPGTAPMAGGRDLMLALDVSLSMSNTDLRAAGKPLERLAAARMVAEKFLERRTGDRVGLLVFGSQAYLHTPLSFDLQAVRDALATAQVGLAGRETALGDAIALAVKYLRELPDNARVLILLTDGANTAGTLAPERAAWLAQRENVRIHVVGIGASGDLDEAALRNISGQTGGLYARATDAAGLVEFFRQIDRIETIESRGAGPRLMRELYHWPLSLAFLLACGLAWRATRRVRA